MTLKFDQRGDVRSPTSPKGFRRLGDMPKLIRFLGIHLLFGAAIGVAFAALVIMSDVSGIKTLIANSEQPYLALALLYAMNALTFASVAMGVAVMTMPLDSPCDMSDPEDRDGDGDKSGKPENR